MGDDRTMALGGTISGNSLERWKTDAPSPASPPDLAWWFGYFKNNAAEPKDIPWEAVQPLAAEEKEAIAASIAAFQLGEYSEGRNLIRVARECAARLEEPDLVEITELFVKNRGRSNGLAGELWKDELLKNTLMVHSARMGPKTSAFFLDSLFGAPCTNFQRRSRMPV